MTTLLDKIGKPAAVLYNNKILSLDNFNVIGVILGSCVFGKSGTIKGKIFNKTLYSLSGEIVAKEQELLSIRLEQFDPVQALFQGWAILEKIKDHYCPWITATEKWHPNNIEVFLEQAQTVKVISTRATRNFV